MQSNISETSYAFKSIRIQMEIDTADSLLLNEFKQNSPISTKTSSVFSAQKVRKNKHKKSKRVKEDLKRVSSVRKMSDIVIETINKFVVSHSSRTELNFPILSDKENMSCFH